MHHRWAVWKLVRKQGLTWLSRSSNIRPIATKLTGMGVSTSQTSLEKKDRLETKSTPFLGDPNIEERASSTTE
jgi:hypothetical protein